MGFRSSALRWTIALSVLVQVRLAARCAEPPAATEPQAKPAEKAQPAPTADDDAERAGKLKERQRLSSEAQSQRDGGRFDEAIATAKDLLDLERALFGPDSKELIGTLRMLAECDEGREDWQWALTYREDVLRRTIACFGKDNYRVLDANLALKWLRQLQELSAEDRASLRAAKIQYARAGALFQAGKYPESIRLSEPVLETVRRLLGPDHPDTAAALRSMATLYVLSGDYARAEPLYQQALEIRTRVLGKAHPSTAQSLSNLGTLYLDADDHAKAKPLLDESVDVMVRAGGDAEPEMATSLIHLARYYYAVRDFPQSESLLQRSLEITKATVGEEHSQMATVLNNLAVIYLMTGEREKQELLLRKSIEIVKKVSGVMHPDYTRRIVNLAMFYRRAREFEKAEALYRESLEIRQKILGEDHPDNAWVLESLALTYLLRGDAASAGPFLERALVIGRRQLELTAVAQSERQQLRMQQGNRVYLDTYLSAAAAAGFDSDAVYAHILRWKGASTARQQAYRRLRGEAAAGGDPQIAERLQGLERSARQLSLLAQSVPGPQQLDEYARQFSEMSDRVDRLQRELAGMSSAFRAGIEQERLAPPDIRVALPEGVVLLDLLTYAHLELPARAEVHGRNDVRVTCFMVQRDGPVRRVDLGSSEPIKSAVNAWRERFGSAAPGQDSPGARLRELVWEPLATHLPPGTHTVLISPDGDLSRIPFAALPGKEPGSYLLEELAIAAVPIPQLLPSLLDSSSSRPREARLLVVGDVDYGPIDLNRPGENGGVENQVELAASEDDEPAQIVKRSAPRSAALRSWKPLPGAQGEILEVAKAFAASFAGAASEELLHEAATEEAVRAGAGRFDYLHFATHGYFAAGGLRPSGDPHAMIGGNGPEVHPGLLTGLVLAGANRPLSSDNEDDGMLTALEIESLDLRRVRLATLSACETGLGTTAYGEGLLGLQRAFHLAGARTVVASLWSVSDDATRALMVEFYENLWKKNLPAIEALRQAQLTMLREGASQKFGPVKDRGLDFKALESADGKDRLHPFYWAAFVLSGDWR
jgi:CHAT domain-containing protein